MSSVTMDDYPRKGTWLYLPLEDLSVGQVGILDFRHGSFVVGMGEDEREYAMVGEVKFLWASDYWLSSRLTEYNSLNPP